MNDKIVFICPIKDQYPQIIPALLCQTHQNWELWLIHNGPCQDFIKEIIKNLTQYEDRVKFTISEHDSGNWGHLRRAEGLERLKDYPADYVVITNADNYYVPVFCAALLTGFKRSKSIVATYCSNTIHSYIGWGVMPAKLALGHLDCGAVMVKKEVACAVGWKDTKSHSSDWIYFHEIIRKFGGDKWVKIPGCLFVHN